MMQHLDEPAPTSEGSSPPQAEARTFADPSPEALALLHEVDHRVKNNLQLIASLIQLQARRSPDEAARQTLKSVLERVNAVTTVHRRLFQDDVRSFEVADFLRDLVGDLAAASGRNDLEISLSLEPVQMPAASAAAFALVANELIGNALKHAFPQGRSGRVAISLSRDGEACVLILTDDGIGLNDEPPGFGLSLTRLLCQQLHAELQLGPAAPGGAQAVVRAPLNRAIA